MIDVALVRQELVKLLAGLNHGSARPYGLSVVFRAGYKRDGCPDPRRAQWRLAWNSCPMSVLTIRIQNGNLEYDVIEKVLLLGSSALGLEQCTRRRPSFSQANFQR